MPCGIAVLHRVLRYSWLAKIAIRSLLYRILAVIEVVHIVSTLRASAGLNVSVRNRYPWIIL